MAPSQAKTPIASTWRALEGQSVTEILAQHPDPLSALHAGEVPAIVLRRVLGEQTVNHTSTMLQRLFELHAQMNTSGNTPGNTSGSFNAQRPPGGPLWKTRSQAFASYGTDFNSLAASGGKIADYVESSRAFLRSYVDHGLTAPIDAILSSLGRLGWQTRLARDTVSGQNFAPGIFRRQGQGAHTEVHFDTLHGATIWDSRVCGVGVPNRKYYQPANLSTPQLKAKIERHNVLQESFADMFSLPDHFSAVATLSAPTAGASNHTRPDVTVYDAHWSRLVNDCSVYGSSHNSGVNIYGRLDRVHPLPRKHHLVLQAGDIYIINSHNIHVVNRVVSSGDWTKTHHARLTFGSFISVDARQRELRMWS